MLHTDTKDHALLLWRTLNEMLVVYETDEMGKDITSELPVFLDTFISLDRKLQKGYAKERVTPYIHILCNHAPVKHRQCKCLASFPVKGWKKIMTS